MDQIHTLILFGLIMFGSISCGFSVHTHSGTVQVWPIYKMCCIKQEGYMRLLIGEPQPILITIGEYLVKIS